MPLLRDQPATEDRLGTRRLLDALERLLFPPGGAVTSITVGVYGSWGAGKSTFLRLLRQRLEAGVTAAPRVVVEFSPWEYRHEPNLLVPLLLTLQKAAKSRAKAQIAKIAAVTGLTVAKHLLYAGVRAVTADTLDPKALAEDVKEAAEEVEGHRPKLELSDLVRLQEMVKKLVQDIQSKVGSKEPGRGSVPATLVFLIDDLDRCHPPDRIVELLEQVKCFLHLDGCAFVLACDREVVVKAIEAKFPGHGERYLEKFVSLPFPLPEPHPDDLRKMVEAELGGGVPVGDPGEWLVYWERLGELVGGNPRRLKRLYNQWLVAWEVLREDQNVTGADPFLLAKWLLLRELSPRLTEQPELVLALQEMVGTGRKVDGGALRLLFHLPASVGPFLALDGHRRFAGPVELATYVHLRAGAVLLTRRELERRAARGEPMPEDLSGFSLAHGWFEGADFTGVDLGGADLRGAWIEGARFDGANLEAASFEGAHFSKVSLRGARNLSTLSPDSVLERFLELQANEVGPS